MTVGSFFGWLMIVIGWIIIFLVGICTLAVGGIVAGEKGWLIILLNTAGIPASIGAALIIGGWALEKHCARKLRDSVD